MILKSLYDYALRLGDKLPREGMELKKIEFTIVIEENGQFKYFESNRIDDKNCASFVVPKGVGRTSAPKANLLWDNGKYVLALSDGDEKYNSLFVAKIKQVAESFPDDKSIKAILNFYAKDKPARIAEMQSDPLFDKVKESISCNFSFRIISENCLVAEKPFLGTGLRKDEDDCVKGRCLVTGEYGELIRLFSPTPLPGNSPVAALISFQSDSGYDSYGKKQAYNAPISKNAESMIYAALRKLQGQDSKNKVKVGSRTFLFWGSKDNAIDHEVVESMSFFLDIMGQKEDNPDDKVIKVRKLFKAIYSGEIKTSLEDRFFILGLAPYSGRIAVVLWSDSSLKDFAKNIYTHMGDMEIVDDRKPDNRRPYVGVFSMVSSVTLKGKISDALPNLIEATTESIIRNTLYPFSLFTSALDRIRAELNENSVTTQRTAIIKAYLNRKTRITNTEKQLMPMLDRSNENQGYLCGRLAAVMEKVQKDAGCGDSIRSRYMGSASATPAAVFPAMLNVSMHHMDNLTEGSKIYYEQLKQEIIDKLSTNGFPAHLSLDDQGRFFIGYYHQRAALYSKKEE